MMEEKKSFSKGQLSGILFIAAAAILLLIAVVRPIRYYFNYQALLCAAAMGFLGVMLLMQRRDKMLLIASGVLALINLLFGGIIGFVGSALLLLAVLVMTTEYLPQLKELVKKAWFVPAIVMFLAELLGVHSFGSLLFALCAGAGALLGCMWLIHPEGVPKKEAEESTCEGGIAPAEVDGYCELFKHVLLLLITFGIWNLIWIYRTTKYLNRVESEEYRKPVTKLLLCMFVPFYMIYWTYKSAQRVDTLAATVGVKSKLATLCLILEVFVPILTPVLLQDKINAIIDVERGVRNSDFEATGEIPAKVSAAAKGTDGYCELFKHMLLMLLTCGIWNLIWIYRMTKYLNRVEGEPERKPVAKLLLCMFIPFYVIYWTYKSAQRIDKLADQTNVDSNLAVYCLILSMVVGLVPQILMQEKINQIIVKETAVA